MTSVRSTHPLATRMIPLPSGVMIPIAILALVIYVAVEATVSRTV